MLWKDVIRCAGCATALFQGWGLAGQGFTLPFGMTPFQGCKLICVCLRFGFTLPFGMTPFQG